MDPFARSSWLALFLAFASGLVVGIAVNSVAGEQTYLTPSDAALWFSAIGTVGAFFAALAAIRQNAKKDDLQRRREKGRSAYQVLNVATQCSMDLYYIQYRYRGVRHEDVMMRKINTAEFYSQLCDGIDSISNRLSFMNSHVGDLLGLFPKTAVVAPKAALLKYAIGSDLFPPPQGAVTGAAIVNIDEAFEGLNKVIQDVINACLVVVSEAKDI